MDALKRLKWDWVSGVLALKNATESLSLALHE